jgi:hypothetical protein
VACRSRRRPVDYREEDDDEVHADDARPGPGGAPLNMPIEVRQVMPGPPE